MTAPDATGPTRLDRWSGGCWVGAGLLLLIGVLHPDVFETTFSDAALDNSCGCRCTPPRWWRSS